MGFVAGELRRHLGGFELDPTAISAGGRLVVPDIEALHARPIPRAALSAPHPALEESLERALTILHDAAHLGLERIGASWLERTREAAGELAGAGLRACAEALHGCVAAVESAQIDASQKMRAAQAWQEAALRLLLAAELA